jgi:hypothetical protein
VSYWDLIFISLFILFVLLLFFRADYLDTIDGPSSNKKSKPNVSDEAIKKQNKLIFKYLDYLKTIRSSVCKELLEYNKQEIPESNLGAVSI